MDEKFLEMIGLAGGSIALKAVFSGSSSSLSDLVKSLSFITQDCK